MEEKYEVTDLLPCRICHEDCAYVEEEGNWCLYVTCGHCGSQTAYCAYETKEQKEEALEKAVMLWNMGKVVAERRGE